MLAPLVMMPTMCSRFLTKTAAHFGWPVAAKIDHRTDSSSFGRVLTADVGRHANAQPNRNPRLTSLRLMAAGSFCGMLGDVKKSELSVLDVDPINLNASCDFSQLVCSDPPGYHKKKTADRGQTMCPSTGRQSVSTGTARLWTLVPCC